MQRGFRDRVLLLRWVPAWSLPGGEPVFRTAKGNEKSMSRPRIVLADERTSFLVAYQELLRSEFDVVGTFSDLASAMTAAVALQPDVIVTALPSLTELGAVRQLKKLVPRTKLLAITKKEDALVASRTLHGCASGMLLRRAAKRELPRALRYLAEGKTYVTASLAKQLAEGSSQSHKALTHRQREVLQLLADGRTMRQAAQMLNLTTRTVAFHKYRIMKDFGLHTNMDLIKLAIREHLASIE
jgi:DNA-binding NarL/FixJ family response regulator